MARIRHEEVQKIEWLNFYDDLNVFSGYAISRVIRAERLSCVRTPSADRLVRADVEELVPDTDLFDIGPRIFERYHDGGEARASLEARAAGYMFNLLSEDRKAIEEAFERWGQETNESIDARKKGELRVLESYVKRLVGE